MVMQGSKRDTNVKNRLLDSVGEGKVCKVKSLSRVRLFVTPWTVAHQAPPSMEFSRQEYWSGRRQGWDNLRE